MTTESWVIGVLGVIVFILAADSFFLRYSKRIAFQWDITEQMSRVFQMLEILTSQGRRIMATAAETRLLVQGIRDKVAVQTTELKSLNVFVETLFAQIKSIINKPDVPQEVKDDLELLFTEVKAQDQPIADAFSENTPAADVPPVA